MTVIQTSPASAAQTAPDREVMASLKRGWKQKCPACTKGDLFASYLKVNDACPACGEQLHHHRADDAPPYFTMSIVGHIMVFGVLFVEQRFAPPVWMQLAVWLPLTALLSLWILPRIKGALIAYQWANRMHGFGVGEFEGADLVPSEPKPATVP